MKSHCTRGGFFVDKNIKYHIIQIENQILTNINTFMAAETFVLRKEPRTLNWREERILKDSLMVKVQTLLDRLAWVDGPENGWRLPKVCDFFNIMEEELSKVTDQEWSHVAPPTLRDVLMCTSRSRERFGAFRAREGEKAEPRNIFLGDVHGRECLSIQQLMSDEKFNTVHFQGLPAELPTSDREFYKLYIALPMMRVRVKDLKSALKTLEKKRT